MIQARDIHPAAIAFDTQKTAMLKLLIGANAYAKLDQREKTMIEAANWSFRKLDRGASLLFQAEECNSVSVILSGWSFRYQALADGKRQILDFALAGALIGFGARCASWHGVETITPCTTASLPVAQFYGLLARCPGFAVQIAERIADSEMRAYAHLTHLGRRNARERVAALIVELISRCRTARQVGSGSELDLPLTLVMIGDALGLSGEHVCRTLAKMADDGVIELKRHSLRVLNTRALFGEAGLDEAQIAPPRPAHALTLAA